MTDAAKVTDGVDVIVVGGGVIGLTTAVVLAERGLRVRVWTRDPAGATTSAVAGALWWPYRIEPAERVGAWALETLCVYEELAAAARRRRAYGWSRGCTAVSGWTALGPWAARSCRAAVDEAEEYCGVGRGRGCRCSTCRCICAWLERRLAAAGGAVERRAVDGFAEAAAQAPVVVNCTGLGARELVPDPAVRPVRGQLVVVENPGIATWFTEADPARPRRRTSSRSRAGLVLGGTAEEDDGRREPDPAVAAGDRARGARRSGRRSRGPGCWGTGWGCGRCGTAGCGWRRRPCRAAGCWCTTTATAARGSPWPGAAHGRRPPWWAEPPPYAWTSRGLGPGTRDPVRVRAPGPGTPGPGMRAARTSASGLGLTSTSASVADRVALRSSVSVAGADTDLEVAVVLGLCPSITANSTASTPISSRTISGSLRRSRISATHMPIMTTTNGAATRIVRFCRPVERVALAVCRRAA